MALISLPSVFRSHGRHVVFVISASESEPGTEISSKRGMLNSSPLRLEIFDGTLANVFGNVWDLEIGESFGS